MLMRPAAKPLVSSGMTDSPIVVQDLTVAYDGRAAVENVSWQAPARGLLAIVGPNGAGKSTLLKAILGLVPVASGKISVHGKSIEEARDEIAYVPQRSSVDWEFPATALDVVAMGLYRRVGWLRPLRRADREQARKCLERVNLAEFADRQIGALSGGQQQRVFVARALAQNARTYLLDEPFAGVDATTEKVLIDVFRSLRDAGSLVVCVHHDLGSVPEIFDHVLLLNRTVISAGPAATAFTETAIAKTYGLPIAGNTGN